MRSLEAPRFDILFMTQVVHIERSIEAVETTNCNMLRFYTWVGVICLFRENFPEQLCRLIKLITTLYNLLMSSTCIAKELKHTLLHSFISNHTSVQCKTVIDINSLNFTSGFYSKQQG